MQKNEKKKKNSEKCKLNVEIKMDFNICWEKKKFTG